jgi:hypothetical protein
MNGRKIGEKASFDEPMKGRKTIFPELFLPMEESSNIAIGSLAPLPRV